MYVSINVSTYVSMYVSMYVSTYVSTYISTCASTYVSTYVLTSILYSPIYLFSTILSGRASCRAFRNTPRYAAREYSYIDDILDNPTIAKYNIEPLLATLWYTLRACIHSIEHTHIYTLIFTQTDRLALCTYTSKYKNRCRLVSV